MVLLYASGKGMQGTTVELTADPSVLGGLPMFAYPQSPSPLLDSCPAVISSTPLIEIHLFSAFAILSGNEFHVNAVTHSTCPLIQKSAFVTKKKGNKPDQETEGSS